MADTVCDLLKRLYEDPDDPTVIPLLDNILGPDTFNAIADHMENCPDCEKFFDGIDPSRENLGRVLKWYRKINDLNKDKALKDLMDKNIDILQEDIDTMDDEDLVQISMSEHFTAYTFMMIVMAGIR